jgi:quaternary ammonium compound-resistance protein SugE
MAWVYLLLAGLLEVVWAIGLKCTEGWSRLYPSLLTVAAMILSFIFLSLALKTLPVGTGYAVWTGIGAAGTAILGIVLFGESREVGRLVCISIGRSKIRRAFQRPGKGWSRSPLRLMSGECSDGRVHSESSGGVLPGS